MQHFFEKRNLGMPALLPILIAYFTGYALTQSFNSLLVAVLLAAVVFTFNFDESVRSAVKQSYLFSFLVNTIFLIFNVLHKLVEFVPSREYGMSYAFGGGITILYKYGLIIINAAVIVIYLLFILFAIFKKEFKFGFLCSILGEATPKPKTPIRQQAPMMYQQPGRQPVNPQPMNPGQQSRPMPGPAQPMLGQGQPMPGQSQPMPGQGQPMPGQMQPMPGQMQPTNQPAQKTNSGVQCPNCKAVNSPESAFCSKCGSILKK